MGFFDAFSRISNEVIMDDNILSAKFKRKYDEMLVGGEESEPYLLAKKYLQMEGRLLDKKVDTLINDWSVKNGLSSGSSEEIHLIMVQAIALMGNRDLMDNDVKCSIIKCIMGTRAADMGKGLLKSLVVKKAASNIPGIGTIAGAAADIASTQAIGAAAKKLFITGEIDGVHEDYLLGIDENSVSAGICKELAKKLKNKYPELTGVYFCHLTGKDTQKITKAMKTFAPVESGENLILMYDSTLFGGADEGLALSDRTLYVSWKYNAFKGMIDYNDIIEATCNVVEHKPADPKNNKPAEFAYEVCIEKTSNEVILLGECLEYNKDLAYALTDCINIVVNVMLEFNSRQTNIQISANNELARMLPTAEINEISAPQEVVDSVGKFCINCNIPLPINAIFCPECGCKQDAEKVSGVEKENDKSFNRNRLLTPKTVQEKKSRGINLKKGQKADLTKSNPSLQKILVGLGWDTNKYDNNVDFDLDVSAFLLCENGKVSDEEDFVFYNNLVHKSGAVQHLGDNLTGEGDGDDEQIIVDLVKVPDNITKIAFVVSIYEPQERKQNFGQVENAYIRLLDKNTNNILAQYDLTEEFSIETAVVVGEIYRYKGEWKFNALGSGFSGGLESVLECYGLQNE